MKYAGTPCNLIIIIVTHVVSLLCSLNPYKEATMTPKYDTVFVLHCIVYNVQHSATCAVTLGFYFNKQLPHPNQRKLQQKLLFRPYFFSLYAYKEHFLFSK